MESVYEKDYKYCPTCKAELVRSPIDHHQHLNCPNCGFIFWNNPKPVVSVLLHKENQVLMLKCKREPFSDFWALPGGFIDYEEEPQEAAIREVKEEVGLDLEIEGLVGTYAITNEPRGREIDIVFAGTTSGEPKIEEETFSEYQYFSLNSLPEKIAYNHRGMIEKWGQNA